MGESSLLADLVVDSRGRESHIVQWLTSMGYPAPKETLVNSYLGYATRIYQKPTGEFDFTILLIRGTPPASKRGGVINPIEGDRWMVTLAGAAKDYPPTDEKGFLEFIRSLPAPNLYQAIKDAVPLTPISGYLKTENRWRHFEQMDQRPEGLVVLGDAVCAFNPVYGQGMTVAVSGALVLAHCLEKSGKNLSGLSKVVPHQLSRVIQGPWLLATGDDYRYTETSGAQRNALTGLTHYYMDHVIYLASQDARIFTLFFEVAHLIKPIRLLFEPWIMVKAIASIAKFQFRAKRQIAKKTLPQEEI